MSDEHTYELHVEFDGYAFVRVSVACPYANVDQSRPCWPHREDGTPEPAPQELCTYKAWLEAVDSAEIVHGLIRVPIACDAEWDDDGLTLHKRAKADA